MYRIVKFPCEKNTKTFFSFPFYVWLLMILEALFSCKISQGSLEYHDCVVCTIFTLVDSIYEAGMDARAPRLVGGSSSPD